MIAVIAGSHIAVSYGLSLAQLLNMNIESMGLFVFALATSLPEIAIAIQSIKKDHIDISLGNAIGTILVNSTLVLGVLSIFSHDTIRLSYVLYTIPFFMLGSLIIAYCFIIRKKRSVWVGISLILLYIVFMMTTFYRF
jgi:cation:H+ antiporter